MSEKAQKGGKLRKATLRQRQNDEAMEDVIDTPVDDVGAAETLDEVNPDAEN